MSFIFNRAFFVSLVLIAASIFQGCSSSKNIQEQSLQNVLNSEERQVQSFSSDSAYKIHNGDEIEILVWEEPKFNTTTSVSNRGTIALPLIGEVQAANHTVEELKQDLHKHLSRYIKGEINLTVSLKNTYSMQVSVLGMVLKPDNYDISEETSIFKVLSMAGGPNEEADTRNVRIYRQNSPSHYTSFNLSEYFEKGSTDAEINVYPGDVIYIPKKKDSGRMVSQFVRDAALIFGIFSVLN